MLSAAARKACHRAVGAGNFFQTNQGSNSINSRNGDALRSFNRPLKITGFQNLRSFSGSSTLFAKTLIKRKADKLKKGDVKAKKVKKILKPKKLSTVPRDSGKAQAMWDAEYGAEQPESLFSRKLTRRASSTLADISFLTSNPTEPKKKRKKEKKKLASMNSSMHSNTAEQAEAEPASAASVSIPSPVAPIVPEKITQQAPKSKSLFIERDVSQERSAQRLAEHNRRMEERLIKEVPIEGHFPTIQIQGLNEKYISLPNEVGVIKEYSDESKRGDLIAAQLGLKVYPSLNIAKKQGLYLVLAVGARLRLRELKARDNVDRRTLRNIVADFVNETVEYKRKHGEMHKSPLIRSVSVADKPKSEVRIVDATGGLGADGFMMAAMGFQVTIVERNPIMYTLLYDAFKVAEQHETIVPILKRIKLVHSDSLDYLASLPESELPDVVYLDPMFPELDKVKASSKKEIFVTKRLIGPEPDAQEMVNTAKAFANHKVVLKRPYYTPVSEGTTAVYKSRSMRWEVFRSNRAPTQHQQQ